MSIQTEDIRQTGSQTLPSDNATDGTRSHQHCLGLAIAAIAVVALLASGIWSRVKARTALRAETAQVALTAVSVVSPKPTAPPRRSSFLEMCSHSLLHRSIRAPMDI